MLYSDVAKFTTVQRALSVANNVFFDSEGLDNVEKPWSKRQVGLHWSEGWLTKGHHHVTAGRDVNPESWLKEISETFHLELFSGINLVNFLS